MTKETYHCQVCDWIYRSPVRLSDPPLHNCKGKTLVPAKRVEDLTP